MKSFPVNTLKANTQLSGTAFLDEGFVLMSPETPITQELLAILQSWGYREVLSEDNLVAKAIVDLDQGEGIGSFQDDAEETLAREETQRFYSDILEFTHRLFDAYLKRSLIAIDPLTEKVKGMLAILKKHRRFLLRLGDLDRNGFSYIVSHSVNVAILSVAIGDSLKLPQHKLIELGMAGLLHELGMFKLPDTFQNANRALTETERRALSAHPLLGYRSLRELGFPPNVTLAVLEHHEKEDGSGYPQGLTSERITPSAKILAVASAYDAQIVARPFRGARSGHATLLELLRDMRKAYDESILRRLLSILSLYPIGSIVQLKNGALAMVNDAHPDDIKHPEVKVLTGTDRTPLVDLPILSTVGRPDCEIVKVLNSDEVRRLRADKILPP